MLETTLNDAPMWLRGRRLFSLFDRRLRRRVWFIAASMIIAALLEGLGIGLVPPFLALILSPDTFAGNRSFAWIHKVVGMPGHTAFVGWACAGLLVIYLFKNIFLAFATYIQFRYVYDGYASLSTRLFDFYLHAPYVFHLRRNPAELLRNVTTESSFVFCQVVLPALTAMTEGLISFVIIVMLVAWEPRGAVFCVIVLGVPSVIFYRKLKVRIVTFGKLQQEQTERMFRWVSQGLAGVKEAQVLGREQFFVKAYEHSAEEFSATVSFYQASLQYPRMLVEIFAVVGVLLVIVSALMGGRQTADVIPILGLFAAAAFRLMPAITRIVSAATTMRYYAPSVDLIHRDFEALEGTRRVRSSEFKSPEPLRDGLVLKGVIYRYPDADSPALNGVSLTIPRGIAVAITGPSGAGKSTLADVILGLLKPEAGQIMADGRDIHQDIASWQSRIGYVPQTVYLYDDTIRRNVAFGIADADRSESQVNEAVEAAQLTDFIASLPLGLDTEIGERGVRLSGGQRQRLGIARALYHDPEVLVMDEATSALDDATENEVNLAIRRLTGRKTILVIAHRSSTVEHCSMRIQVERGIVTTSIASGFGV